MGFSLEYQNEDDAAFGWQLRKETERLRSAFLEGAFANEGFDIGFELELQLLDKDQKPKRVSLNLLKQMNSSYVVPEMYASMIEFNSKHFSITGGGLLKAHQHLRALWRYCARVCRKNYIDLVAIGSLPTFSAEDINEQYLTDLPRYKKMTARLKEQYPDSDILVSRNGTCNGFHLHFRIPAGRAADYYNAANIASAPVLAVSGNSPYFLKNHLWQESRIYVFESCGGKNLRQKGRAFLGDHYVRRNFFELFQENLKFPLILSALNTKTPDPFWHLMLHNGTIWRWNRPVISLYGQGPLHVRIEHRSLPSGPTVIDMLANALFWIGLTKAIGDDIQNYMLYSPFQRIKHNFYVAAQYGLDQPLFWPRRGEILPQTLIVEHLLPLAYEGLKSLDMPLALIKMYLGVIRHRACTGQTGSRWQQNFMAHHPGEWSEMVKVYVKEQQKDNPIAEWDNV